MIPMLRPEGGAPDAPQTATPVAGDGEDVASFGLVFATVAVADEQTPPKVAQEITATRAVEKALPDQTTVDGSGRAVEVAPQAAAPAKVETVAKAPTAEGFVSDPRRPDQTPTADTRPPVTPQTQVSVAQTVVEGRLPVRQDPVPVPIAEASAKAAEPAVRPPHQLASATLQPASATLLPNAALTAPRKEEVSMPKSADAPPEVRALSTPVAKGAASVIPSTNTMLAQLALANPDLSDKSRQVSEPDIGFAPIQSERPGAMVQASTIAPTPGGAQIAHHAATQIAQAMAGSAAGPTEISLNPEELGRVRLSMTASDGTIALTIAAERPETADLLRRNINALAQEFRALGYDDLSFSFGATSDGGANADQAATDEAPIEIVQEAGDSPPVTQADDGDNGLDLRL